jgi:hypothetical protein
MFVVDAYRSLGCKSFGNGAVPGNLGAGSGPATIIDCGLGGPCPPPSCAIASVVAVDAITKNVTIAHFILVLLRVNRGGGEVPPKSVGNIAGWRFHQKRAASGDCPQRPSNLICFVTKINRPSETPEPSETVVI